MITKYLLMAGLLAHAGCLADETADELGTTAQPAVVDNGRNLNGRNLNGRNLNGSELGATLLSTSFEGVKVEGVVMNHTELQGTVFHGLNGSSEWSGDDFLQSEFSALSDEGHEVRLRVVQIDLPAAGSDTWRYWVEYRDTDNSWYPICQDPSTGVSEAAIPIDGWWDPGSGAKVADPARFTFACPTQGAIGKCIDIGYRPWAEVGGVALDGHHQGCVRAMRADYCGDGISYTTDGKLINLYDGLGIQIDAEDWQIEAEWDGSGARCFSPNNRALSTVHCFKQRTSSACGKLSNFSSGSLLMTEMP